MINMTEPIVEFVPPKLTIDSVDVTVKDDNIIEIKTQYTVWVDDEGYQPTFNYNIGDTYFSRDGMEISCAPKQHVFADILTIKVNDLFNYKVFIDIDDESKIVNLRDYIKINISEDAEYPDVGLWVML